MTQITSPTTHALYIHWPFCLKKCPYCDFNSHVREEVDAQAWQQALLGELGWYHAQAEARRISSIFFGGGTPSLMPPSLVAALIEEAERLFGLTETCEITLEANPTSVEVEKLAALKRAGVNRVSLGIQSLRAEALQFLGREHSVSEALHALEQAAKLFTRYSFDLIYALPDQTAAAWEAELTEALAYAGDHLSLYQLTIEPGTQFYHHYHAGKFQLPKEELAADLYQLTQSRMEQAGLPAYEISNHARPDQAAQHNVHIWRGGSYLGIGPGAHGRMDSADGTRYASYNLRSPEKWLAQQQSHGHGNDSLTTLTAREITEESILMGLRLREGLAVNTRHWPASYLEALQEEGLIDYNASHITPTPQGQLLLNQLTHGLVEEFRAIDD